MRAADYGQGDQGPEVPKLPWVFYTDEGQRPHWFYKAWGSPCTRAGVAELIFHDLRRSAVRDTERAGIPRKVAMSISGHKTENIYRRYDIVAHRDLADAAARMDQYFRTIKARQPKRAEPQEDERAGWAHFWTHRSMRTRG